MNKIDIVDVAAKLMVAEYGAVGVNVASVFKETWSRKNFEDQNFNNLKQIKKSIDYLLKSGVLNDDATEALEDYKNQLNNF